MYKRHVYSIRALHRSHLSNDNIGRVDGSLASLLNTRITGNRNYLEFPSMSIDASVVL